MYHTCPLDARDHGKLTTEMLVARAVVVKALRGQAGRGRVGRGKCRPRADFVFLAGGEALARVLYDGGADAGAANRKQLRGTLLALSLGD